MSKAKWIMGGLGFVLGGPIGALIGVLLGSLYEGFSSGDIDQFDTSSEQVTGGDVNISFLVLVACVMKADGRVLKSDPSLSTQECHRYTSDCPRCGMFCR